MQQQQFDRLDEIAVSLAKGDAADFGVLSTGEKVYVALAANDMAALEAEGFTIAGALARLGDKDTAELIFRWQYRGNPKKFAAEN